MGQPQARIVRTWVEYLERMLAGLDWIARRRGRSRNLPAHLLTGIDGEEAVFFYLRRKGYTVVARRWSAGNMPGDIDLVAWDGPLVCFVEVKTRTEHDVSPAESTVDKHKRGILRRLARQYLRHLPQEIVPAVRFDVIAVYLVPGAAPEFTHFESAFGWNEFRRHGA